ncbi:MAG TPA: LytTR family DNA-binding domain-containing protein [Burkholderiaceae bacterium]|nr:LytTR family DNA-binding domain-containing protein [Burkholderiaceae bacterium]
MTLLMTPDRTPDAPAPTELSALLRLLTEFEPLDRMVRDATRPPLRWISASRGQDLVLIHVDEVLYFQSDTKYTRIVTADAEALIRMSLRALQGELDPESFWQIHRSTIVNVRAIAGARRTPRGSWVVRLKSRAETLAISESHVHRFHQM